KTEMAALGSLLLTAAEEARIPAGAALAVDRDIFSARMTELIAGHPRITVERREVTTLPEGPTVLATGPLTSNALAEEIAALLGGDGLAFYDAIAPIVSGDSIDMSVAYFLSRYGKGGGDDYLNCPLDRDQYLAFVRALREADIYPGREWENIVIDGEGSEPTAIPGAESADTRGSFSGAAGRLGPGGVPYFEGCLPIEVLAARGDDTLRFGPMKPAGLPGPRTGREPCAVLQLRREDKAGQMWNLVGFQTRLRTGEQRRVFRMIPGLENAEFL